MSGYPDIADSASGRSSRRSSGVVDDRPHDIRGVGIARRDGVRVVVQRGRLPFMIESLRYNRQSDTRLEQFGRHEMTEIMIMPMSA